MGIELKNLDKFCGYATPEKYSALVALYRVAMGNGISVQQSQSLLGACYLVTLYHNWHLLQSSQGLACIVPLR